MPHIVPIIPIGTFIRNTNRHEIDVSIPPTTGPRRNPAENAIPFTPNPNPTLPLRKASVTITALLVRRSAPPTPCTMRSVSYTHLRAHETRHDLVCRLLLEKKKKQNNRT